MKALTIYQPWASLIMAGAKPYEFRGWNPRRRGGAYAALIGQRIVIHASARKIDRSEVMDLITVLQRGGEAAAETCLDASIALPILNRALAKQVRTERGFIDLGAHGDLPWSVGLGTAILGEPRLGTEIAEEFGVPRANDSDRDAHANWGWPMLDIEVWDMPIECRGLQGFWNWPTPEGAGL
jgi:hypothetical protein